MQLLRKGHRKRAINRLDDCCTSWSSSPARSGSVRVCRKEQESGEEHLRSFLAGKDGWALSPINELGGGQTGRHAAGWFVAPSTLGGSFQSRGPEQPHWPSGWCLGRFLTLPDLVTRRCFVLSWLSPPCTQNCDILWVYLREMKTE